MEVEKKREWTDSRGHRHVTTTYKPEPGFLGNPKYGLVQITDIDMDLAVRVYGDDKGERDA